MRQLRVRRRSCQLNFTCEDEYSFSDEENRSFEPGWKTTNLTSSVQRAFQYQSGDELDSYPIIGQHHSYRSGGYVYDFRGRLRELRGNLSQLHQFNWIDSQTRAVIIQISLYNPNVNLFVSLTILTEFLATGGLAPQSRIEPFSHQSNSLPILCLQPQFRCFIVSISIFQLVCFILYMILIAYLMIKHTRSVMFRCRLRSLCQFWTCLDLGLVGCSWSSVAMLIWKNVEQKRIARLFASTNGYVYINLQRAVYIDDLARFFLSFCCFFACVKCLRLCRFHQRLSFFSKTIQHVSKDLFGFSLMFSILFTAFLCLFYFLFIGQVATCATLLHTAQMLFEMVLMKFDAQQLIQAHPTLGPIAFCLFILLVVFVCMSMFITIVSEGFRYVRDHPQAHSGEEQEAFVYMLRRFQQWLGQFIVESTCASSFRLGLGERKGAMPEKRMTPVEHLPEKIDQLLDALHRVIITIAFRFMILLSFQLSIHEPMRDLNIYRP